MQNITTLNDVYADFSAGLLERRELEGAVFKAIQADVRLHGLHGLRREDCDDFVSWLYPRISRAIGSYREIGSTFEAYISSLVRMSVKEYRQRQARSYAAESAAWITQLPDMHACESGPQYECMPKYECDPPGGDGPARLKNPREHLILILKC